MPTQIDIQPGPPLLVGAVEIEDVRLGPASEQLQAECSTLVQRIQAAGVNAEGGSAFMSEMQRSAVRRALKGGGFSPTGRNRPAHELLLNMVLENGAFPHINNVVDVNNLLSLELLVPISLLDAAKLGGQATLRWGADCESYVFNQSGHVLDLKRCLVVAGSTGQPLGSPIKDGMHGKVFAGCNSLVGIIYASSELFDAQRLEAGLARFASLLERETGGARVQLRVLTPSAP